MFLFLAIALSILWVSGLVLGLALCAMLGRAEGHEASRPRPRPQRARADRIAALDRLTDRVMPIG